MSSLPTWLVSAIAFVLPGFGQPPDEVFNGYLEGDYVHVAPSGSGRIVSLTVQEGDQVVLGQLVLQLEDTRQKASLRAAQAQVAVAQANLTNLQTGRRSEEIEVIRATLTRAEADQHLAQTTLERSQQLSARGLLPSAQVEAEMAALDSADALVTQLSAELRVAELPARDAQVVAAEASLAAARAQADLARSALDDRIVLSPATGLVERVFFSAGEVVGTGAPTMSILPPGNLKALFFLPEPERAQFAIGDMLALSCDGCTDGLAVEITRMASDPQYTPPILYSRDERARLVFRAEGILTDSLGLLPGQPITLRREP
ncbi:MAG: HlyD family efflux transporter periplasmic adaptor subunit [Marinosulfonomonas sp.]|nr:HlyD family efflux transporter periplasmic adaptor subunit [Marinosulfonomonas sp.]